MRDCCCRRPSPNGEFIDYTISIITDEDPLRGLLVYWDLGFSHTLHVLVPRGEKMLYSGTDPESYITEDTLVYEENIGEQPRVYHTRLW